MRMLYDLRYKISTYVPPAVNPLLGVSFSDAEDVNKYSILESVIKNYIVKDIHSLYGLNIIEFLQLPYDVAEMLMDIANEKLSEKIKNMKALEKEEKNLQNNLLKGFR